MQVNIANLYLQLYSYLDPTRYFKWAFPFQENHEISSSLPFYFQQRDFIEIQGNEVYTEGSLHWHRNNDGYEIAIHDKETHEYVGLLYADLNWTSVTITKTPEAQEGIFRTLAEIAFRIIILFHQGFGIHSSAINYLGHGIVFSAPSGTGKSTHAELWKTHKGAEIFVEDRSTIRMIDDDVKVFGTPWSGTPDRKLNQSVPLKAIVFLEQSAENSIQEITPKEYLQRILPRTYLPYFDETLMHQAISNIEAIMPKVPAYLLKCRPDKEAVDTVFKELAL